MIVMIMGMSKSGTTLAARTLDASGINFRPERKRGEYPGCPYENLEGCNICMEQIGADRKRSLYLPKDIKDYNISKYIESRSAIDQDWGFKFPYLTFVYGSWKKYLPEHIVIGVKRKPEGLAHHYWKRGREGLSEKSRLDIFRVQKTYNDLIDSYDIPIVQFEEMILNGPGSLEKIIGRKLKDVRDGRKHKV